MKISYKRDSRKKINALTKRDVKLFLSLKSIDQETKKSLLKRIRHTSAQLNEIEILRENINQLLFVIYVISLVYSFISGPSFFIRFAREANFNADLLPLLIDNSKQAFTVIINFLWGMIIVILAPFLLMLFSILLSKRISAYTRLRSLLPLVLSISFICFSMLYLHILYTTRTDLPSLGLQSFAAGLATTLNMILYLFFFTLVFLIFNSIFKSQMRKSFSDAFIIQRFVHILHSIEKNPHKWGEVRFKRTLIVGLEEVANYFEFYLAFRLRSGNLYNDQWLRDTSEQIAAGIRSLERWIYTPKPDTRERLIKLLARNLVLAGTGAWDSLDRITPEKLSRPELIRTRVQTVLAALLSGAVPILVVHIVKYSGVLDESTLKPLMLSAYLWAMVTVLTHLDASFSAKLANVKELTQWLPFPGKKDKD